MYPLVQTRTYLKRDISAFFKVAGIGRSVIVEMPAFASDPDVIGTRKKGWLYGAFLAFRKYRERYGSVDSFATIGTGFGGDAIGACELLNPKKVIVTDIHPRIPSVARRNIVAHVYPLPEVSAFVGNLCEPLLRSGVTVDLLYANIPNIPSKQSVPRGKNRTYFKGEIECPAIFEQYLLAHQHLLLTQAHSVLALDGRVISAIGGRFPLDIIASLFSDTGYRAQELASIFKYQTEALDVLSGYARAEKRYDIEFDFYMYSDAQRIWEVLESKQPTSSEIKKALRPYKVSATKAWNLYHSGTCRDFGIVAQYVCGEKI